MSYIVSEKRIWRELVQVRSFIAIITHSSLLSSQAHFTASQVQFILNKKPELKENKNCRRLYLELRKHFGVKQKYSELIMLCKNCRYFHNNHSEFVFNIYKLFRCVFWSSYGHPCLASADNYDAPIPLSPATFLSFFNV